tara:strand:+ start:4840 stop:5829 length:990 start_codon:yes stop_codon:yes gene_type:complete
MKNKKILIIGGTGALGQTLIDRYHKTNDIIVFSRDEHKHVNLKNKYKNLGINIHEPAGASSTKIKFHIGDVKDKSSIMQALNEYKPDVIINTAALKHVPVCESNPYESVKTNIIGHKNLIDCVCASQHNIETLMFISTDKACAPINVYGMCKAISERLYVDFANKQTDIKVCLCRYGNVLESTGSVIPFFKDLLSQGKLELPITHKDMTRFLLTLDHAVDLIEWSYSHPESHGKIVIPKIKALKITDIAKSLGKAYGDKITLKYVGIRPGEKLHEAMISLEESLRTVDYKDYYMITDDILSNKPWSFSSDISLMKSEETDSFLKVSGVL